MPIHSLPLANSANKLQIHYIWNFYEGVEGKKGKVVSVYFNFS